MDTLIESELDRRDALLSAYTAALADYLEGAGEAALTRGYELGRKAASLGAGLLELAMIHHEALVEFGQRSSGEGPNLLLAAQFLTETLSPFEMTLRAYKTNARLLGLSEGLARQNAEISRAHEQLRSILDATTAVIYLKDVDGRYLFVNRQFQTVFQIDREKVVGKRDADVLPPEVAAVLESHDRNVIAQRAPQQVEETFLEHEGEPHTYISLKFPLVDSEGAAHAICCVATDITERKRADDALHRAKEAAEDANRELESFSYSVAHDLRAPLRSIDGFSLALLEDCGEQLDTDGKKYIHLVRESAQRMARLIEDLLALSRVTRREIRRTRVDLSGLATSIAERLKATDPRRAVEFSIESAVWAQADPGLLSVVLENLLGNAWKFTSKCGRALIEFGARQDRANSRIHFVRDNGAGFDMTYADKLFGVFQRLHRADEFEGTGIGLATVHRCIRRHGGRVWAEGAVDRGASFYFTLGY